MICKCGHHTNNHRGNKRAKTACAVKLCKCEKYERFDAGIPAWQNQTVLRRFWPKIRKTNTCWLWTSAVDGPGYGTITISGKRMVKAHRLMWEYTHKKEIQMGMVIMHNCDVRNCCNPDHLTLGTVTENNRDRERKGRSAPVDCENHPRTFLTNKQVIDIYKRATSGENMAAIAREVGLSKSAIGAIKRGKAWSKVTGASDGRR